MIPVVLEVKWEYDRHTQSAPQLMPAMRARYLKYIDNKNISVNVNGQFPA